MDGLFDAIRLGRSAALGLALTLAWQAARADSPEEDELALVYGDKSTVSLATGRLQPLRRAPAVASVITAEEIAAMGASDLDQVLEAVPGVHVLRSPVLYAPIFVIRGIGGAGPLNAQVLMLQNGIPVTDVYNSDKGNSWFSLPVQDIARIEILRGPGSALYGAEAFAGVINIITKTAERGDGTTLGAQAGSLRARDGWVEYGGALGAATLAAYLQVGSTDGIHSLIAADAQTLNDSRFGTHASLAPGPVSAGRRAIDGNLDLSYGHWRWRANLKYRDRGGMGAGVNSALDPNHVSKSERLTSDLGWSDSAFADHWSVDATLAVMYYTEQTPRGLGLFPPGARIGPSFFPDGMIGGPDRWERNVRAGASAIYSGWDGHTVHGGVGHDDLDLYRADTFKNFLLSPAGLPIPSGPVIDYGAIQPHILPQRRQIDYAYLQDEWQFARDWVMTAGLRHDHYSDFGGTTNPRLALVWEAGLDLTAKLLYGRAFRAPSFNEQHGINPVNSGNPALRPETIVTSEAALAWQAQRNLALNLNLFDYGMRDLIRTVTNPAPAPGSTYANVGRVKGRGLEFEVLWDPSKQLRLSGNLALQRAVDQATLRDPGYSPREHAYLRLDWLPGADWHLNPQLNRVQGRRRAAGDLRAPIADYTTLDLNLGTRLGKWELSVAAHNLANADAREPTLAPGLTLPYDLPVAPRTLTIQAVLKL